MARRKAASGKDSSADTGTPSAHGAADSNTSINPSDPPRKLEGHSLQGKLTEVDLGEEARSRNEAMTDRARRIAQGESVHEEEQSARAKKVRLGRDGKPWQPRNRRGSDAVKRDQMVEDILRENRRRPPLPPSSSGTPLY